MAAPPAAISPWRRLWVPLAATLSVQISVNVSILSVAVLAPVIGPDLGVPAAWAGYFVALAYLAGAVVSAWSDRLLAPVGPMTASLIAQMMAMGALLLASTGELTLLALAALVAGSALGLTTPTSSEILAANAPPALYGRVFSIKQTAVPGAGLLVGLTSPTLAHQLGWQGALLATAALLAGLGLALSTWRRRLDAARLQRRPRTGSPIAAVLADPLLLRLCLAGFCLAGVQLCLSTFFTAHLVLEVGLPLALAGALYGLLQAMGVPARVVWGWLADQFFGVRQTITVLAVLATLGVAILTQVGPGTSPLLIAALAAFLGLSIMSWTGLLLAAAAQIDPARASTLTAGAMMFNFLGIVALPPLFGFVVARTDSYAAGFTLAAAVSLTAVLLLATVRRRQGIG
ncbi:MAG: MFS transporter [Geminicoccaceae bacterium]|nr:MAG: MFS transporter [Geminicoccaceae bacterium]